MLDQLLAIAKLVPTMTDSWRASVDRADGDRAQLRMLYLECLQNLDVLAHFRLDEPGDAEPSAFLAAVPLLKIAAHEAVLLRKDVTDDDRTRIEDEKVRLIKIAAIRVELNPTLEAEIDGVVSHVDAKIEPDEVQQDVMQSLRESRKVTLHEALVSVTTKVRVLSALGSLGEDSKPARRSLRVAQRLRYIRDVERAIRRDLLPHGALFGLDTSHG